MRSGRIKFPFWVVLRLAIRDGWKCFYCEFGHKSSDPWEVAHDIAVSKGGRNKFKNLHLAHRSCNREMSNA